MLQKWALRWKHRRFGDIDQSTEPLAPFPEGTATMTDRLTGGDFSDRQAVVHFMTTHPGPACHRHVWSRGCILWEVLFALWGLASGSLSPSALMLTHSVEITWDLTWVTQVRPLCLRSICSSQVPDPSSWKHSQHSQRQQTTPRPPGSETHTVHPWKHLRLSPCRRFQKAFIWAY